MRLWSLLLGAACSDYTSLMQNPKPPSHQHRKSVANLMEAATHLLKNGATPDVVNFTNATITEVEDVVFPAIRNESETDQAALFEQHDRFAQIEADLSDNNQQVAILWNQTVGHSHDHKTCRDEEEIKCDNKRQCDMDLYAKWSHWVSCENDLKKDHDNIHGQFCAPPGRVVDEEWVDGVNGTLHIFRETAKVHLNEYIIQKPICDTAISDYNGHIQLCDSNVTALDDKSLECNKHQEDLEEDACHHHREISDVLSEYHNDYTTANNSYNFLVNTTKQKQEDRIQEYVTLKVVNCLLDRVHERNGRPCDETTGEIEDELGNCSALRDTVDYDFLLLTYRPAPPHVAPCLSPDKVVGHGPCLPVHQPAPCSHAWHAQEMAVPTPLPAVPEATFSHTNPGCNAYPVCTECPLHVVD